MHERSEIPRPLVREFRVAPEFRRCGWFAALGTALVLGAEAWLKRQGLLPMGAGWIGFTAVAVVLVVAAIAFLVALYRWRLRVDETGIWRRRLAHWDSWPWGEFEDGTIERRGNTFVSSSRPRWRNRLRFDFLEEADKEFLLNVCRYFFRPHEEAPIAAPAGALTVRYGLFRTVTIREDGFSRRATSGACEHAWNDLKQVRLVYFDHWSTELRRIELELPNRTLRVEFIASVISEVEGRQHIRNHRVIPSMVARFLQSYVPLEKLATFALKGPPRTLAECEHRMRGAQRELDRLNRSCQFMIVASFVLLALTYLLPRVIVPLQQGPPPFLNRGVFALVIMLNVWMIVSPPLILWSVWRYARTIRRKEVDDLIAWKAQHLSTAGTQSPD